MSQAALAGLAGCSRQYVAQLEAGRRRRPSLRSTHALANALQLAGEERRAFFAAAGHGAGAGPLPPAGAASPDSPGPERFAELMTMSVAAAQATRLPAYVHDSLWRLHGWNRRAVELFEVDPGRVVPGELSILDFLFDAGYRRRFLRWETLARAALAQFKRDSRARIRQPEAAALLRRLRRLPDFRRLWATVEAAPDGAPTLAFSLRHAGLVLHLRVLRLRVLDHADVWFNVFLPADLAGRPGREAASEAEAVRRDAGPSSPGLLPASAPGAVGGPVDLSVGDPRDRRRPSAVRAAAHATAAAGRK